ncbi:MAG: septal ring lytic transglycosylase RlpA family protein [Azospirillaceae bacterium]|nr:septal ring lytic transglycosylase RlpA family protein [Azospirillaceae bacterium]
MKVGLGALATCFTAGFCQEASAHAAKSERKPIFVQHGVASWYGEHEYGHRTASGAVLSPHMLTAAHRSLPFGTKLRVFHHKSGRSVDVVVNDRGPHVPGRILDLSKAAAVKLGIRDSGVALVMVTAFPEGQSPAIRAALASAHHRRTA